jgi:hypothetical protein
VTFFYVLLALAALVLLLFLLSLRSAWRHRRVLPYAIEAPLFSPEEVSFLTALEEAVGADHRVFGKVRLADLVTPRRRADKQALKQAAARIANLKIDFLVCRRESAKPVCAVALSGAKPGRGHNRGQALARACDALGLPLLRVPQADAYSVRALAEQVYTAMYAPKVTAPVGRLGAAGDDGLSRAEEEEALSVLAAAIRDGDPMPKPGVS